MRRPPRTTGWWRGAPTGKARVVHDPGARHRHRARSRRRDPRRLRRDRLGGRLGHVLLCGTRREPPACPGQAHRVGTSQTDDELIYETAEVGWFVDVDLTSSHAFVTISVSDHETSEEWLLDRNDPQAVPRLVAPRRDNVRYDVEHHGDELLIHANADGAEDFKVVAAPLSAPGPANWRDLVPHRPGTMILYHLAFRGHYARLEREDAKPRIVVRDLASGEEHAIAFQEETYSLSLMRGHEFDTEVLRFTYSSMTTPAEVYDYNMRTRERVLRKRQEIPSGHDPAAYVTKRLLATAHDGEQIPVSLLYRADVKLDGSAPCLLYGYGSYGSSMPASFRTNQLSLVDRGFVYAIAHVRGGTEKGWRWYVDGKRDKKPNTFKDFISCSEALIAEGYTRPGRIVGLGGSAGGMLMGAVANMAPGCLLPSSPTCRSSTSSTPCSTATFRSRRRSGPSGATPAPTRLPSGRSCPTRPTTTCGPSAIPPSWRSAASPIPGSPTGSRRSGSLGFAPP
jgi:hypothetical protein